MRARPYSLCLLLLPLLAAGAGERRSGEIALSDGTSCRGELSFTNGELRVYELGEKAKGRYVTVRQEELERISFEVKERSMEHPWRFKEAGSDEKEILPGTYPLINLEASVVLKDGRTLKGHLMNAPLYVRMPDGENPMDFTTKKFHLKYQLKGEVGQAYTDLVHVTEIRFLDAAQRDSAGRNGTIRGKLEGLGKLEQVAAYGLSRSHAYVGKIDAGQGTYVLADLPPDRYDLAVLTDRGIFIGLSESDAGNQGESRPLEKDDQATVAKAVAGFRDFFDVQEVQRLKGTRDSARALVLQIRMAPVHDQQAMRGRQLRRLDLWQFHMRQTEWHINENGRANLFRYDEPAQGPPRTVTELPALAGVQVSPEKKADVECSYRAEAEAKEGAEKP